MSFSKLSWRRTLVALLFLGLGGCDLPTGEPSINTRTDLNTPLVSEKTFSFIGGPESEFEPLVDTTSSEFRSLFEVEDDPKDVSIVQEIDNFDIGSLDDALNNASGDLSFDGREFNEKFIDLSEFTPPSFSDQRVGDVVSEEDLRVSASGIVEVSSANRVAFKRSNDDFVELGNSRVRAHGVNATPKAPQRVYDELTYVYDDIRLKPYEEDDILKVKFVPDPCGQDPCENGVFQREISKIEDGFDLQVQDVRVFPDKPNIESEGRFDYEIRGKVNSDLVVDDDDEVSFKVTTSIEEYELQGLEVSEAKPFTVEVTPDADASGEPGEGEIDIADEEEARISSFEGLGTFTGRVDGLELVDVRLTSSVRTKNLASTDAQVFAALQGRNETERLFLAGKQDTDRGVSSSDLDRFDADFVENGRSIGAGSLLHFGIDLEEASLGETTTPPPNVFNEDNSNASDFVNAFPSEVRLIGQAEVNTDGGDLEVREPVDLNAALRLDVPLQFKDQFVVRDTAEVDFSDLEDLTDSGNDLSVSTAELRFGYTNRLPMGAEVQMVVVDDQGGTGRTFSEAFENDDFRIAPAPKRDNGTAEGEATGQFVFNLGNTKDELRELARGDDLQFVLHMIQESGEAAARLRAFADASFVRMLR